MRQMRSHWQGLAHEPKQQFYELLAELRGTSVEHEQRVATDDGFDELLARWMQAHEEDDLRTAIRLQREDARFGALRRL
jgi:hypothetical protein